jgi:DNA-directed RNA polymerase subunit beta
VSGLEKTLRSVFPIRDFAGTAELDFVNYELEEPKYDIDECRQRGMTYAAPMRVTLRLIVFEVDPDTETRSVLDIKEQDVYMGDMPLMTKNGTFIVNGTERVIVSQMHRSPGVLFDHDRGKTHASGKYLFAARVIPYRGSWLDFEFDAKDIVNVRIDRKRKLPVTALLHALDMSSEEILNDLLQPRHLRARRQRLADPLRAEQWRGQKPSFDIVNGETGEVVFPAGTKITPRAANKAAKDGLASSSSRPRRFSAAIPPSISSTTRPARSTSRRATRSAPRISRSSTRPASTGSSCSTSITSTPAPGCATR